MSRVKEVGGEKGGLYLKCNGKTLESFKAKKWQNVIFFIVLGMESRASPC